MQSLKHSEPVQPLDRRPRRVPSRGALAAVLFGVVVLTSFAHTTSILLFLLAGIAGLAAILRWHRPGRGPRGWCAGVSRRLHLVEGEQREAGRVPDAPIRRVRGA